MTWTGIAVLTVVGLVILMIANQAHGLRDAARETDDTNTPPRQPHRRKRGPGRLLDDIEHNGMPEDG